MFAAVLTLVACRRIGAAGHQRVRGRVPGPARHLPHPSRGRGHRRHRRHLRRGVPAVGAAAGDLLQARQAGEPGAHRSHRPRVGRPGAALAVILWLGLSPGPVLRRMEPSARHFIEAVQGRVAPAEAQGTPASPDASPPARWPTRGCRDAPRPRPRLGPPAGGSPETVLALWAMLLLLDAAWHHKEPGAQRRTGLLALVGIALAAAATVLAVGVGRTGRRHLHQPGGGPVPLRRGPDRAAGRGAGRAVLRGLPRARGDPRSPSTTCWSCSPPWA